MQSNLPGYILIAFLLSNSFYTVHSFEEFIITQKALLQKLCEDGCSQSTDQQLIKHCERGCQFFFLAQASELLEVNTTLAGVYCNDSCTEAYAEETNKNACQIGCNKAEAEVEQLDQMVKHLVEETERKMNFINSIMDYVSSFMRSIPEENPESYEYAEDNGAQNPSLLDPINLFGDNLAKINRLDKVNNNDVEIITLMANDALPVDSKLCNARKWVHMLSFILVLMGAVLLVALSCFYIAAIHKYRMANKKENEAVDNSAPPSYDTLVKSHYLVVGGMMPGVIGDNMKKQLIA